MESIIIIAPTPIDFVERLGTKLAIVQNIDSGLVIKSEVSRVYISSAPEVAAEYQQDELARITAEINRPVFYTVDFSDISLCRRVLLLVSDDATLIIDNDHGLVMPGDRFSKRLRAAPDWDWRNDKPW